LASSLYSWTKQCISISAITGHISTFM
jgi:hypothetical protein